MWNFRTGTYYSLLTRKQAIEAGYPVPDGAIGLRVYLTPIIKEEERSPVPFRHLQFGSGVLYCDTPHHVPVQVEVEEASIEWPTISRDYGPFVSNDKVGVNGRLTRVDMEAFGRLFFDPHVLRFNWTRSLIECSACGWSTLIGEDVEETELEVRIFAKACHDLGDFGKLRVIHGWA